VEYATFPAASGAKWNPMSGSAQHVGALLLLLLTLVVIMVTVAPRLRLPPMVGLVLIGLLLNVSGLISGMTISPDFVFYVLLPIVIFEASFNMGVRDFLADWPRTVALAFPGVAVVCVVVFAGLVGLGQAWQAALLVAAILAATDPVSVIATFRELHAPPRLTTVVETESIMNDGTGAVASAVAVAIVTGAAVTPASVTIELAWMCAAGVGIGALAALGGLTVYRFASDWRIEVSVSLIIAYGCFFIAQSAGASGVLAAMTAGFILGNWGPRWRLERESSHTLRRWWEFAAYFVNGLVFLLIGLVIDWRIVLDRWPLVLATFALTLGARAIIVWSFDLLLRPLRQRVPASWNVLLWWGGLRATVPLALTLALPSDIPYRDLVSALVYGCVLGSLFIEGLTVAPLARRLGVLEKQEQESPGAPISEATEPAKDSGVKADDPGPPDEHGATMGGPQRVSG
jgi:monovalent cation:H+ antiporter, CPA1 family